MQGNTVPEIAELTGVPVRTLYEWRDAEKWHAEFADEMCIVTCQRRWMVLCDREDKSESDYGEMEALLKQLDTLVAISNKKLLGEAHAQAVQDGAMEASQASGGDGKKRKRKKGKRNDFRDVEPDELVRLFREWCRAYQWEWWENRHERIRNLLASRQVGKTIYFAREAFVRALVDGQNEIFISASRAQAGIFREYIKQAVREWFDRDLVGRDEIVIETRHGRVTLYFLSTNSATAQGYHGNVYVDEAFWIPKFGELNRVASAMAAQKQYTRTYCSTPSAKSHAMYPFWSGDLHNTQRKKAGKPLVKFPPMNALRERGQRCADGQWRRVLTIVDAIALGCDDFDLEQLKAEWGDAAFRQLFMCEFIDDSAGVFRLSQLEPCMVDACTWRDVDMDSTPPYAGPVWIGYDPARHGDGAEIAVLAPPATVRGKFRVVEKLRLKGVAWQKQADIIRELCGQYQVEYMGVDTTGQGSGVFEMVQAFFPQATPIYYTLDSKTRLVLKAQQVIGDGRLQWDAGASDITGAFLQIRRAVTTHGRVTFVADRDEATGHADAAWAIMHALIHEGLLLPDESSQVVLAVQD